MFTHNHDDITALLDTMWLHDFFLEKHRVLVLPRHNVVVVQQHNVPVLKKHNVLVLQSTSSDAVLRYYDAIYVYSDAISTLFVVFRRYSEAMFGLPTLFRRYVGYSDALLRQM